jgi:hypothetical protein
MWAFALPRSALQYVIQRMTDTTASDIILGIRKGITLEAKVGEKLSWVVSAEYFFVLVLCINAGGT